MEADSTEVEEEEEEKAEEEEVKKKGQERVSFEFRTFDLMFKLGYVVWVLKCMV